MKHPQACTVGAAPDLFLPRACFRRRYATREHRPAWRMTKIERRTARGFFFVSLHSCKGGSTKVPPSDRDVCFSVPEEFGRGDERLGCWLSCTSSLLLVFRNCVTNGVWSPAFSSSKEKKDPFFRPPTLFMPRTNIVQSQAGATDN